MSREPKIRHGHSLVADEREAVQDLYRQLEQSDPGLVIFFCSSHYDLDRLTSALNELFRDVPLVGCTSAGEIGPHGYCSQSLSGVSFPAGLCSAVIGRLDNLQQFSMVEGQKFVQEQLQQLEALAPQASGENSFAFLMIDGLSIREEPVVHSLQYGLGRIPLVGGSAGDDLRFEQTRVFHEGRFHSDSAVMVLATTPLPYKTFKTQHFVPGKERMVVTEADPATRTVYEISGYPASDEYARLLGVTIDDLAPGRFAESPVVVLIDGTDYVRAIQSANEDKSLTFYCAIEEGLVLREAQGVDLVENLRHSLESVKQDMGDLALVLACDCVLRRLEVTQKKLENRMGEIMNDYQVVGFNTYGEQYGGVHVNQTLTGIAFGHMVETADE